MLGQPIATTQYTMQTLAPWLTYHSHERGPDSRCWEIEGVLLADNGDDPVARVRAYRFENHPADWMALEDRIPLLEELCRAFGQSAETGIDFEAVLGLNYHDALSGDVLIIDRLEVRPQDQGVGVGRAVLEDMIRGPGRGATIAALRAFPLQYERLPGGALLPSPWGVAWHAAMDLVNRGEPVEEAYRAVKEFYTRAGFQEIPGAQAVMVRNLAAEKIDNSIASATMGASTRGAAGESA